MSAWLRRTVGAVHFLIGGSLLWMGFASAPARGLFSGAKSLQEFGAVGLLLGGLSLIFRNEKLARCCFWSAFATFLLLTVFAWFARVGPAMWVPCIVGLIGASGSFLTVCVLEDKRWKLRP